MLAPAAERTRWWVEALTVVWLAGCTTRSRTSRRCAWPRRSRTAARSSASSARWASPPSTRWTAGWPGITPSALAVSYYYDNAHFAVTLGLLGYLWWRRADIYRPLRNSLVLINLLGFVVFWRYPVAPPRMLGGFTDVVAASHTLGSWHTGALASDANQLAAMPSLHLAWAAWCTVAVWRITKRPALRALGVLYPVLTGFAVLATGNHYVLDIVGGLMLTALSVAIVAAAPGAWARMRGRPAGETAAA